MSIPHYLQLEKIPCYFGVIYFLFLMIVFRFCGIWHIIWILPLIIFIQTHMQYDVVNSIYEVNKIIPTAIFNSLCLNIV